MHSKNSAKASSYARCTVWDTIGTSRFMLDEKGPDVLLDFFFFFFFLCALSTFIRELLLLVRVYQPSGRKKKNVNSSWLRFSGVEARNFHVFFFTSVVVVVGTHAIFRGFQDFSNFYSLDPSVSGIYSSFSYAVRALYKFSITPRVDFPRFSPLLLTGKNNFPINSSRTTKLYPFR